MTKNHRLEKERKRIIHYSRTALNELQNAIDYGNEHTIAQKGRMRVLAGEFRMRLGMLKRKDIS
jgi:hypothetical protein